MKQVLQNLRSGATACFDVPTPRIAPGHLLIATQRSLISAGTERMLVEFGQVGLLAKARSQPERVQQVLDKIRADGVVTTMDAVFDKLDQPLPLGYCNSGRCIGIGQDTTGFQVNDRVVSSSPHAELVSTSQNLCARIPGRVADEEAAFTVLGAVALQGIRLLQPTLGERIVVSGLGLLGLMAVQMLRANGCQVLGIDYNAERLALAARFGAQTVNLAAGEDPVAAGMAFSDGVGVDGVLITASTKSDEVVHQAAEMSRKRGRIVLVGVVGLNLRRADFYEKELTFQVSCSYGPGRYDPTYEEQGHDYPIGFVRWTEQRNFEAVLQLMADGKLDVKPLISHRVPFENAPEAYRLLTEDPSALGIILTYPDTPPDLARTITLKPDVPAVVAQAPTDPVLPVLGVIGAGNFTSRTLLPALQKCDVQLRTIASSGGTSAAIAGRKFGFVQATSDAQTILDDPAVNTVVITTRHNSHARLVVAALAAGKHVFVEKPLCLNREELYAIQVALQAANSPLAPRPAQLLVGFNRRFAPLAVQMQKLLAARSEPLSLVYTVNAGAIPADHWTQDPESGGGRIIGEACHFIDLLRFFVGAPITGVDAHKLGDAPGMAVRDDKMTILLHFEDGSTGVVHYLANGSKRFPKERIEAFCQGRTLVLDNFRALQSYGWPGLGKARSWRQDKGHAAEMAAFIDRVRTGGPLLIPWAELEEVTLATFVAVERASLPLSPLRPSVEPYTSDWPNTLTE